MNEKNRHYTLEIRRASHRGDVVMLRTSEHLLDLTESDEEKKVKAKALAKRSLSKRPKPYIFRMLNEHLHLRDLRTKSLSAHPRGWKDFPPKGATTMPQAISMTVSRFFREHPLADLTILATAHLLVVLIWNLLIAPGRLIFKLFTAPKPARRKPAIPVMPFIMAPAPIAAVPSARRTAPLRFAWQTPTDWRKSVFAFGAICLVLVVPFGALNSFTSLRNQKTDVMNEGLDGMRLLRVAGVAAKAQDFSAAGLAFSQAENRFSNARERLGVMGKVLSSAISILPVNSSISAASPLLTSGKELAAAGSIIAEGFTKVDGEKDPVKKIAALRAHLTSSLPHLDAAEAAMRRVNPEAVPENYKTEIETAQRELPKLVESVRQATAIAGMLPSILGVGGAKRYLVLFQNNAELRPTGGFIGSFALLDVKNAKVENVEIPGGGSYDLKGSLRAKIVSPQPLHLINARWQFQDANWSPDFPTSAKMLRWFYEKSGGPTTDGVIGITSTMMERLLEVTGPIAMPEYGKTIDSANFYFETQKEVELDFDKAQNKPKKFIGDLAPKVLGKLLDADQHTYTKLIAVLDKALQEKQLLMWFTDPTIETKATKFGWTGELKQTDGDYLAIIHTNIGGQKTDLVMKDEVDHAVKILPDGGAIVTLTVTRSHTGVRGALFSGVRNVDYMRVYVPKGSTLVDAKGFRPPDPKLFKLADAGYAADPSIQAEEDAAKIDRTSGTSVSTESGKTVFGNWTQTDPGQTSVLTIVYRLPPGIITAPPRQQGRLAGLYDKLLGDASTRLSYSLFIQKQPGAQPASFTSRIDAPRGYDLSWQSEQRKTDDRGRWTATKTLDGDSFSSVLLESR